LSFRYFIIDHTQNSSVEELRDTFEGDEVILGRGGRSHIILQSRLISLEHALLEKRGSDFYIKDLGSTTGVVLNGLPVIEHKLKKGDSLQLGDLELRIEVGHDSLSIIQELKKKQITAAQKVTPALTDYLPGLPVFSALCCLVIFACFFLWPVKAKDYSLWSSGPISNKHAMFANDCAVCHSMNFGGVKDEQCTQCHSMTEHLLPDFVSHAHFGGQTAAKPHSEWPLLTSQHACVDCHSEHSGDRNLIMYHSGLCVSCHGDNSGALSDRDILKVASFDLHPQFRPSFLTESGAATNGSNFGIERISLDERNIKDLGTLKLNHAVHLKEGILGADGPVTLSCADCHNISPDGKTMLPISYEAHCASCHALSYEEDIPGALLPHTDPDSVFSFLLGTYARLELQRDFSPEELRSFGRVRPGHTPAEAVVPSHTAGKILERSRTAEWEVFERTACVLCHDISERSESDSDYTLRSNYEVLHPRIQDIWMPKAKFKHTAHITMSCVSCHHEVYESTKTSDLLLPGVETCQECHTSLSGKGQSQVVSDCIMCHSFHDKLSLEDEAHSVIKSIIFGER